MSLYNVIIEQPRLRKSKASLDTKLVINSLNLVLINIGCKDYLGGLRISLIMSRFDCTTVRSCLRLNHVNSLAAERRCFGKVDNGDFQFRTSELDCRAEVNVNMKERDRKKK